MYRKYADFILSLECNDIHFCINCDHRFFVLFCFRYEPELLSCPLTSSTKVPHAVSLTKSPCEAATHFLWVTNNSRETNINGAYVNLTICVAPLVQNINDVRQLVEFIEINNLFGGQKFVFYKASCGWNLRRYLTQYELQGLVDAVIPWELPVDTAKRRRIDIKYYGQSATLIDCLYRNLYRTKYIAFLDLDEILVSRAPNVSSVVTFLEPDPKVCNFQFKHILFRRHWNDDEESTKDPAIKAYNVQSLLKTRRDDYIWPFNKRSKYIAKTDMLEIPGIHFPHSCIKDKWQPSVVKEEHGLLHHYRRMGAMNRFYSPTKSTVRDYAFRHYKDDIIERIKAMHSIMEKHNHLWAMRYHAQRENRNREKIVFVKSILPVINLNLNF